MRFLSLLMTVVLAMAALLVGVTTTFASAGVQAQLAQVRQATAKYHDVNAAIADGYVQASPCVEMPGQGAMGIHFLNPALAQDLSSDPLQPELLLYFPGPNGHLRLVGVEYFAPALTMTSEGPAPWFSTEPPSNFFNPAPSVLGHTFDGPMAGHDPSMPWHYDLHVWIWQANPSGTFSQYNPNLSCPAM